MSEETTLQFTTPSVPASSQVDFDEAIKARLIEITFIKVAPSDSGGPFRLQLYRKTVRAADDIVYNMDAFTGIYFDPEERDSADVVTERPAGGERIKYADEDAATRELHGRIINSDSVAKTFTITVRYRELRPGSNVETLAAAKTIEADDPTFQVLDPGGAARDVLLPPEIEGKIVFIKNAADAAEDLTVKEDSGVTTIGTVSQGEMGVFVCDGTSWHAAVAAST